MTTLIVTLPLTLPGNTTEYDYALTQDGLTLIDHGRAAALLPAPATHTLAAEVVAVVPARALSWHQVTLPKGTRADSVSNPQRLRAVLCGLLEEKLLDDPEHLHFALSPKPHADALVWVAVCNRAWLHAWLHALEAAQQNVSRIVPEFAPEIQSPQASQTNTLYITEGLLPAQLVAPSPQGVMVLPLSRAALTLMVRSEHAAWVAEPSVASVAEEWLQRPVSLQSSAHRALTAAQSSWNLAQFDLINTGSTRTLKRLNSVWQTFLHTPQWRAARWGSVLLVSINVLGLNAWAWKERSVIDSQRAALRATLSDTFPEVKVVVDAPVQMARALTQLQQATGATSGQDLEAMLDHLSALLPGKQSVKAIDFSAGEASLKGLTLSTEEAAALMAMMKTKGYTVRSEADSLIIRQAAQP
jgi:general secretion pathway protein L